MVKNLPLPFEFFNPIFWVVVPEITVAGEVVVAPLKSAMEVALLFTQAYLVLLDEVEKFPYALGAGVI